MPEIDICSKNMGIAVSRRGTAQRQAGRKWYPTEDDAKVAALDALIWAKLIFDGRLSNLCGVARQQGSTAKP